jgi:hypothetical protein
MSKPMREAYPEIAACVDDLRAQGFVIERAAVYDPSGALVAGREPAYDPSECVLPAERVIAMQKWARTPAPVAAKAAPKQKKRGKRR